MNLGFHRVDGGEGRGGGGGKGRIWIPFPLPPSINFFSRNNQLSYSNNLITLIVRRVSYTLKNVWEKSLFN